MTTYDETSPLYDLQRSYYAKMGLGQNSDGSLDVTRVNIGQDQDAVVIHDDAAATTSVAVGTPANSDGTWTCGHIKGKKMVYVRALGANADSVLTLTAQVQYAVGGDYHPLVGSDGAAVSLVAFTPGASAAYCAFAFDYDCAAVRFVMTATNHDVKNVRIACGGTA